MASRRCSASLKTAAAAALGDDDDSSLGSCWNSSECTSTGDRTRRGIGMMMVLCIEFFAKTKQEEIFLSETRVLIFVGVLGILAHGYFFVVVVVKGKRSRALEPTPTSSRAYELST